MNDTFHERGIESGAVRKVSVCSDAVKLQQQYGGGSRARRRRKESFGDRREMPGIRFGMAGNDGS